METVQRLREIIKQFGLTRKVEKYNKYPQFETGTTSTFQVQYSNKHHGIILECTKIFISIFYFYLSLIHTNK